MAHAWARRGADLRVEAPGRARRRAVLGVLDHAAGRPTVVTSATERSGDLAGLLARLGRDYGPGPGRDSRPVVLALDNGPVHTGEASRKALAGRPWPTVEWLPKHAPELNGTERSWRDLKRHRLANRTFRDADRPDRAIHDAVAALDRNHAAHPWADIQQAA